MSCGSNDNLIFKVYAVLFCCLLLLLACNLRLPLVSANAIWGRWRSFPRLTDLTPLRCMGQRTFPRLCIYLGMMPSASAASRMVFLGCGEESCALWGRREPQGPGTCGGIPLASVPYYVVSLGKWAESQCWQGEGHFLWLFKVSKPFQSVPLLVQSVLPSDVGRTPNQPVRGISLSVPAQGAYSWCARLSKD